MRTFNKRKWLTILQNAYSGDRVLVAAASRSQGLFEDEEREAFSQFQVDVGNLFIELKEELDQGLEDMADAFPDETDPRKWDEWDWHTVNVAIEDHPFEEIYRTYAKGEPNMHLIWRELEARIEF